jgi:hypothetical protein
MVVVAVVVVVAMVVVEMVGVGQVAKGQAHQQSWALDRACCHCRT